MSIRDDFLEALRSVKKDLFREYDSTEPHEEEEPQFSQIFASHDQVPPAAPAAPVYAAADGDGDVTPPRSDAPAPPYAAPLSDNPYAGIHIAPEEDEEDYAPDVDPTPYRTAEGEDEPRAGDGDAGFDGAYAAAGFAGDGYGDDRGYGGGNGDGGDEPPRDNRMIFDDGNGSYGDDRTIISKNTVIRGALQSEDSVRMFGQILGDIDCKANILVAGKVRGNTSAANAYVIDAQVDGNLLCDDVVNVTDDAWILGNIRAQQAEIDGKIKGNIEIRHTISIGANSSVIGNISTDELEIKRGAFVNGQIMMYSPSRDVIDRFDQFER